MHCMASQTFLLCVTRPLCLGSGDEIRSFHGSHESSNLYGYTEWCMVMMTHYVAYESIKTNKIKFLH